MTLLYKNGHSFSIRKKQVVNIISTNYSHKFKAIYILKFEFNLSLNTQSSKSF